MNEHVCFALFAASRRALVVFLASRMDLTLCRVYPGMQYGCRMISKGKREGRIDGTRHEIVFSFFIKIVLIIRQISCDTRNF